MDRYKPYENVSFEERTPGDLLEEFYMVVASEVDSLANRRADLDPEDLERLSTLENILVPETEKRVALKGLSEQESEEVWSTAHSTGDLMADYWEYRIAKGLPVDLDLTEVPPKREWSRVA